MARLFDQLTIFGGNSNPGLTADICDYLGLPQGRAEVFKFSNDNTFVRIGESVRDHDVFVVQSFANPINDSIMELLIMIDTLKRASAGRITAVIPYFGYGRTDKKDQPRVPITARLVAKLIGTSGADRVLSIDLHAGQIQGFFDIPVDEMTAMPLLCRYFRAIAPRTTGGGLARSGQYQARAQLRGVSDAPLAIIEKRRVGNADHSEVLNLIGSVENAEVVIIDDEIDTAGSITQAAQVCFENGASDVYATCTHAVFSGPALERLQTSAIREVVVSNTISHRADASRRSPSFRSRRCWRKRSNAFMPAPVFRRRFARPTPCRTVFSPACRCLPTPMKRVRAGNRTLATRSRGLLDNGHPITTSRASSVGV